MPCLKVFRVDPVPLKLYFFPFTNASGRSAVIGLRIQDIQDLKIQASSAVQWKAFEAKRVAG